MSIGYSTIVRDSFPLLPYYFSVTICRKSARVRLLAYSRKDWRWSRRGPEASSISLGWVVCSFEDRLWCCWCPNTFTAFTFPVCPKSCIQGGARSTLIVSKESCRTKPSAAKWCETSVPEKVISKLVVYVQGRNGPKSHDVRVDGSSVRVDSDA